MRVRDAEFHDARALAEIYNHYVLTSHATFEIDPIDADEMERRMDDSLTRGLPFLVAEADGEIRGYAFAQPYKPRAAYQHSVEVSIYVDPTAVRQGIGNALYQELFDRLWASGVHAVIAGVSLPNDASVHLHEKFAMTKVAHLREVGRKFDRWIDVGYWELVLDDTSI